MKATKVNELTTATINELLRELCSRADSLVIALNIGQNNFIDFIGDEIDVMGLSRGLAIHVEAVQLELSKRRAKEQLDGIQRPYDEEWKRGSNN